MKLFYKNQKIGIIACKNGLVYHGKILRIKKNKDDYEYYDYKAKLLYKNKKITVKMRNLGRNSMYSTLDSDEDIVIFPCFKDALLNCLSSFEQFRIEANRSDDGPIPQMDEVEYSRGMFSFATYHYQMKKLRKCI